MGRASDGALEKPHAGDGGTAGWISSLPDGVKWIYSEGTRNPEKISPDNWNTDLFFLGRPENHRIQLDLFYDYRTNVDQYPRWHEYLRKNQPPTLLVWGANDPIFTQEGGRAFQRDVKRC